MTILDQPQSAQTIVYASFIERAIARIIDAFVVMLPSIFFPLIGPWLYFALMEGGNKGATLGKRAVGIRVISVDGSPIGFGTATGRFLGNLIEICTFGLGYLLMFFNARNQCLHDAITSTVVIRDRGGAYVPTPQKPSVQKRSWTAKTDADTHFIEIHATGGKYWRRGPSGEQTQDFTLWQLTDDMVDFSPEFGPDAFQEMKQYAEKILRKEV